MQAQIDEFESQVQWTPKEESLSKVTALTESVYKIR
jgi:hypothetical protein